MERKDQCRDVVHGTAGKQEAKFGYLSWKKEEKLCASEMPGL